MSTADRKRWDARFADLEAVEPGPPTALAGREDLVPTTGRALDVACGRGAVAVWLARRGLDVEAVDVSPVALAAGRALAGEVHWVEADLDDGLPVDGPYDVVVCQRFRDPALYPALVDALAPGGLLVVTVLTGEGAFRAPPGELLAAFGHLDVLHHDAGDREEGLVARRPLTPAAASPGPRRDPGR
ncbi:class I SAM-dependent methyltransferase [Actinomycetospora straminea]|uniref:Class I SAM-dependent methyltransferase n=1 Tax=Actinomycetospora straminea TaxID=663607 RepID=A0ABP9DZU1_9PSEU|nr:class I SAM-dependent methyltransferase [Actinomycetospora straminea]MDD7935199.1 class I SAM-dependent methyltransferase [Actinomycetospora straminea]